MGSSCHTAFDNSRISGLWRPMLLMAVCTSNGGIWSSLSSFCFPSKWKVKRYPCQLALLDALINTHCDKTCIDLALLPTSSQHAAFSSPLPPSLPSPPHSPTPSPYAFTVRMKGSNFHQQSSRSILRCGGKGGRTHTLSHTHTHFILHTGSFVPVVTGPVSLWWCHSHPLITVLQISPLSVCVCLRAHVCQFPRSLNPHNGPTSQKAVINLW